MVLVTNTFNKLLLLITETEFKTLANWYSTWIYADELCDVILV